MPKKKLRRKPKRKLKGVSFGKISSQFFQMLPYLISFCFVGLLLGGSYAYAVQSDLFHLKDVQIKAFPHMPIRQRFAMVGLQPNSSVVSINLKEIELRIKKYHPQFKDVLVRRLMPDKLDVHLTQRTPIAKVVLRDEYWIDETNVVVEGPKTSSGKLFPKIVGIPLPKEKITIGSRIHFVALEQTLHLIKEIEERGVMGGHLLSQVDLKDSRNLTLIIDDEIEVRMGIRNLSEKLNRLSDALQTIEIRPEKVSYIDLRFDDIIIGPK